MIVDDGPWGRSEDWDNVQQGATSGSSECSKTDTKVQQD